ncbi:MAG: tetratricopeptide repeat protein [Bacteroidales bacterium]|nr:tetratricopeptide repeat protein [Bacteroidales bacterium]
MHSRIKLVIISVFITLCSHGQNFDKTNHFLSDGKNILPENFESLLDSLSISLSLPPDSLRRYKAWLLSDRKRLLAGNNEFYKVHYYIELAKVHGALDEYETAYRSIDSALVAFDHNSFPGAYKKVINAAIAIARKYKDYHALIRYLEMLLQSGTIDHDSLSLGHVLIEMAQLHLGLHQYKESSEYACKALPVLQKNGDTHGMVDLLVVMYHDSFHINSDTTNMDYLSQARDIAFESGDSMAIANVYENIGMSYYRDGKQQNAIEYYKLARSYIPEKGLNT